MKYRTMVVIPMLGLAAMTTTNEAFAWGDWGWHGCGYSCLGSPSDDNPCCGVSGPGPDDNGYNAGIADANYDHNNGLMYNPVGNCLPCHSQEYWNAFHQGYDTQWKTYQNSQQTVNNYLTINGNGNYVNLNQRQNSKQLGGGPWGGEQPQGCCYGNGPGPDP